MRKGERWKNVEMSPEVKRDLKKEALIREAAAVFREHGFHATSLTTVTDRLGITKAALYYYIKDKEELFFECHMAAMDEAESAISPVIVAELNGIEKLRLALARYLFSVLEPGSFSVVIAEQQPLKPDHWKTVVKRRDRFERILRGFVVAGIEDGSIVPCDPKLTLLCLMGSMQWASKWFRSGQRYSPQAVAAYAAELAIRAIAATPRPPLPNPLDKEAAHDLLRVGSG